MASDETTPLLATTTSGKTIESKSRLRNFFNVENRLLLTAFLITLSFSYTQVSLVYVFRLMTCESYYDRNPPYTGDGDRCSLNEIDAGTATEFSILGMTTTLCGTINLFVAGWMVKKFGARSALLWQTFVPAIRVATQIVGVLAGKRIGIAIIQSTQVITIIGGPVGYILIVNIIAGEIVEPIRRTAVFGKLQGCLMFGNGIGLLTGGMLGNTFGVRAPFDLAFVSFIFAGIVARFALPYIPPIAARNKQPSFLAPLRLLTPQRVRLANGKIVKHYGVLILCAGIFTGVFATDYAPLMIQLYATAVFNFDQAANGWLMSEFSFTRSLFLIILFPRIISAGRKLFSSRHHEADDISPAPSPTTELPTKPANFVAPTAIQSSQEPIAPKKTSSDDALASQFDLVFLRWSLVVDGALTTVAAFATKPWHIYLAAFLLPFGSGTAPAAKGVITQMCSESQRADALNVVTLVENVARLATQGLFGFVFSSLASVGKAYITFFCNAAIAVIGMAVLLCSNFPPEGSSVIDEDEELDDETNETNE